MHRYVIPISHMLGPASEGQCVGNPPEGGSVLNERNIDLKSWNHLSDNLFGHFMTFKWRLSEPEKRIILSEAG